MGESEVTFKATVDGLILVLKGDSDFDDVLGQIEKKLEMAGKFFKGASISVKYRGRKLSREEENSVLRLLQDRTGAEIKSFEEDSNGAVKVQEEETDAAGSRFKMRMLFFKGIDEGMTKFCRGTVRSGQLVSYDGNIVVIGDVNPGGEVIATGNVVVFGALRGIVHAGADGNRESVVVALNLQPTQLRIADVITRSPDEKDMRPQPVPELAYIKGDMVYTERFLPQYK